jgi:formylglycine-generating enzyme required for sulfatase activity/tetratricopeptide (TPR) repeat protein
VVTAGLLLSLTFLLPYGSAAQAAAGSGVHAREKQVPGPYRELLSSAASRRSRRDYRGAMVAILECLKLDDERYEAHALGALILLEQGEDQRARRWVETALLHAPEDRREPLEQLAARIAVSDRAARRQQHLSAARAALATNLPAKAASELDSAWLLDPSDVEVGRGAVAAYLKSDRPERAAEILRLLATALPPESRGDVQEHLDRLQPLLSLARDRRVEEARGKLESADPAGALAAASAALQIDPASAVAWHLSASSRVLLGQLEHGVSDLRESVRLGLADREHLVSAPALRRLRGNARYVELVADVLGPEASAEAARLSTPILPWATLVEREPDPAVVRDPRQRQRILETDLPWRVRDTASGIEMLLVPGGRFLRGAPTDDPDAYADERPQHAVEITRPFYLGRWEVTASEWARLSGSPIERDGEDRLPASGLAPRTIQTVLARSNGLRLPTEAEWELACRAGTTVSRYGDLDRIAWHGRIARAAPHPVGSKAGNDLGFHDMLGNVSECCSGGYDAREYARCSSGCIDPTAPSTSDCVVRGGSFHDAPDRVRASCRHFLTVDASSRSVGFRVARDPSGP